MDRLEPQPRPGAGEIFDAYFSKLFDELTFRRAKTIFDELGWQNGRQLSTLFNLAFRTSKLEQVLDIFEAIMDSEEGLANLTTDKVQLAANVRLLVDSVNLHIVGGGRAEDYVGLTTIIKMPDEFREMDAYEPSDPNDPEVPSS